MNILSLNAGSSSLKFAVHRFSSSGECERLVLGNLDVGAMDLANTVRRALGTCEALGPLGAVGCRVVHGGSRFSETTLVNQEVIETIRSLAPLAPLHNARDLETIEVARAVLPEAKVAAVFDTAFHRTLPTVAHTYALPKALAEAHDLRRFGFHGISYRYVSGVLRKGLPNKSRRMVLCHLGSGASACALLDGVSVDTSMGMTPLEGLVMSTRSGDIDPGLLLFLMRELNMPIADVDRMLNSVSGLVGVSGLGGDVRELEAAAEAGNPDADLALELFAYRAAKTIGAYTAVLEGLDCLGFCGGIGENSASMRQRICRPLRFLGIELDEALNVASLDVGARSIGRDSGVAVWIVRTDEERQIAQETFELIG